MCSLFSAGKLQWDDVSNVHAIDHVEDEGTHQDYHTVRHNKYFSFLMVADRTVRFAVAHACVYVCATCDFQHSDGLRWQVGLLSLLLAGLCNIAQTSLARRIALEAGGAKRINAASTFFAAFWLLPVGLHQYFSNSVYGKKFGSLEV